MMLHYGVVESTMRLAEFLSHWLSLLACIASVNVYSVDGNHGEIRPLGSRKGDFTNENMEKILMWFLAARLDGYDSLTIDPDSRAMKLIDVQGYSFLMTHGDTQKALSDYARQTMLLYGKPIDYFLCAHRWRVHYKSARRNACTCNG